MKPAPFLYLRPDSLEGVHAALAEYGDEAKLLAGGQSLLPLINFRLARPAVLVDLALVPGLDGMSVAEDGLRLGAMVRQWTIERSAQVTRDWPLLPRALAHVGHVQIRHRGTIGGSIAHADPAAELPAVCLALDAEFVVSSATGQRTLPVGTFFTGPFGTTLGSDEVLTEVRIPPSAGQVMAFAELARRYGDFALAGVAAIAGNGRVRLAAFGVGWTAVRLQRAEACLAGSPLDDAAIAAASAAASQEVEPIDDIHADAAYRRELLGVLVGRVLGELRG
ncbi:MAG: FAD binding domain-containing protein [Candidatus Limnocylindrales bacterium]